MKRRSIHERNGNQAIIAGLKNIAFINRMADTWANNDQVGAGERDRANDGLQ